MSLMTTAIQERLTAQGVRIEHKVPSPEKMLSVNESSESGHSVELRFPCGSIARIRMLTPQHGSKIYATYKATKDSEVEMICENIRNDQELDQAIRTIEQRAKM